MLLSRTFRPSEDLAPYIRRYYIFEAELPEEMVIEDFLLAETAFIRCMLAGDWKGEMSPGVWEYPADTLLAGANERPFPVRVKGSFKVLGIAIRPCGFKALFPWPHHQFRDRMIPLSDLWGDMANSMEAELRSATSDEAILDCMEGTLRQRLAEVGTYETDDAMAQLEAIARTDSKMLVEEVAARAGLSTRQLERRCRDTFGLTPKAVLRRSRFLDMATAMRGFSSPSETDLAALRYFDQSHLNKEFKRFTRMTPKQFEKAVTPLQTAGLKLREESLYED